MLNRKKALTLTGILILISIAIFLMSQQTPPETVVIYKAVEFTPKTETDTPSASHPNSDVEMGALVNEDRDVSETDIDDSVESTETALLFDELFFGEILDETESEYTEAEIVAVSPFGYGEYPEIPTDYPWMPIWTLSDEDRKHYSQGHPEGERGIELMQRVGIKLWQTGHTFTGIAHSHTNGRIYPNFPDTVYVDVQQTETGTSISVTGSFISDEDIELIKNGGTPHGITVLDMSEGIEPFSFLGL